MLAYWLLLLIPAALYFLLKITGIKNSDKTVLTLFFTELLLLLILRDISCGIDLTSYQYYFVNISATPWKYLRAWDLETGYVLYVKLISAFTDNYQVFLAITAIITTLPLMALYRKNDDNALLGILLFVNTDIFTMMFSGLRQAIAIAIGVLAYGAVKEKKTLRFLLLVIIASLFHKSAFVLILLYPLYNIKISSRYSIFALSGLFVAFILRKRLFMLIGAVIIKFGIDYDATLTDTGAYTMIILFFIFYIFSLAIPDENKADKELQGLRNILMFAIVIQTFAPLNNTVMRVGYYFIAFVPILIPKVIKCAKEQLKDVARLANVVMCIFFAVYFFYNAYRGQDILHIYPYVPFWEGI